MLLHARQTLMKCLLLAAATAGALHAQWDTRLQKGKTDFLDLYQASGNKKAKPEVVTLFDFSGSMEAVMFHGSYPNNDTGDSATGDGQMTFTRSGSNSTNWAVTASLNLTNTGAYGGSFANLTNGVLIRPDGSVVTRAGVNTTSSSTSVLMTGTTPTSVTLAGQAAADKASDVRNWIRACSHIRFTYVDGTVTRTVDVPVPWRIMNAASTGYPLSGQTQYDSVTGLNVELDTSFAVSGAQGNLWTNSSTTASVLVPAYRTDYLRWIFKGKDIAGKYIISDAVNGGISADGTARTAFANGIPNRTRTQAVKEAAIRTWIAYQSKVFWAFRFLNPGGENGTSSLNPSTTSPGITNSGTFTTTTTTGNDRSWFLLNNTTASPNNSRTGMQRIAALFASGNTPLTYAVSNTIAQFQDANSVFNAVEVGDDAPQDCSKHFLIAFTDGQPTSDSNPTNTTVYIGNGTTGSANAGNKAINTAGTASMNAGATNWNIMNWAGVAAHGQDSDISVTNKIAVPTYPAGASSPQYFVPGWIKSRNGFTFSSPHPIQVMTVGVSLGGALTNPAGGKFRLFSAATVGDPRVHSWDISKVKPFELTNPADPNSAPVTGSVYFFDAASPDNLVNYLQAAFKAIDDISGQNITATPVVPFSGVALAKQIYLGRFELPDPNAPSPYWNGDLLMFPTGTVGGKSQILQNDGTPVAALDGTTAQALAQWSARSILNQANYWSTRTVYTRPVATVANPNPGLSLFTDQTGTGKLDDFQANMDASLTLAQKQDLVRWTRGADTTATAPYPNRSNLMGDIINSAPAVLEYSSTTSGLPSTLSSALSNHPKAKLRVLLVGTNTGFLHAFGEVSWEDPIILDGKNTTIVRGVADELWSFIPTDFLPYLQKLRDNTQLHRFMVDGSPVIYHQDRPAGTSLAGDLIVNNSEKAYVIFGLRKGGRSYYSLDISDPMNPKMAWSLRADESATIPASRVLKGNAASVQNLVNSMGFSTSQPGLGRVYYTNPNTGAVNIRRAVFLGGGLSVPEIEVAAASGGFGKVLGRNAIALDAGTGEILQSWDLSALPNIASVPAGVVPFQYFTNSGMVQRAYFGDRNGNIWALGSTEKSSTSPYGGFRIDNSFLDKWTVDGTTTGTPAVRAIYQAPAREKLSTLPSPFNVGAFPVYRTSDPKVAPAAVGIAFVTGDRNNPLDLWYDASNLAPLQHRLHMVFDRQDSYLLGLDTLGVNSSQLQDMSTQTTSGAAVIDSGSNSYYLKSKYGYYINFPAPTTSGTQTFIPKGVNEPIVLAGVLFYSYFRPTKGDTCNPGAGVTRTLRVCDVMNPVVNANAASTSTSACTPGFVMEWAGVASNFAAKGTAAVTQAGGVLDVGGSSTGVGTGKVALGDAAGNYSETFPKPRVWRSVHSEQN